MNISTYIERDADFIHFSAALNLLRAFSINSTRRWCSSKFEAFLLSISRLLEFKSRKLSQLFSEVSLSNFWNTNFFNVFYYFYCQFKISSPFFAQRERKTVSHVLQWNTRTQLDSYTHFSTIVETRARKWAKIVQFERMDKSFSTRRKFSLSQEKLWWSKNTNKLWHAQMYWWSRKMLNDRLAKIWHPTKPISDQNETKRDRIIRWTGLQTCWTHWHDAVVCHMIQIHHVVSFQHYEGHSFEEIGEFTQII